MPIPSRQIQTVVMFIGGVSRYKGPDPSRVGFINSPLASCIGGGIDLEGK